MSSKQLSAFLTNSPIVLGTLVLVLLLAITGGVIIANQQHIVQQGSALVRAEHHIISALSRLQREHHLLVDLVQTNQRTTAKIDQQRADVDRRLQELTTHLAAADLTPMMQEKLEGYRQTWAAIEQGLASWINQPTTRPPATLLAHLEEGELILDALLALSEHAFATHVDNWSMSLNRLKQLLFTTAALFAITALLTLSGFVQMLVQRQHTDEALRASEHRHRALLETIPDAVLRRRRDGVYTDFKPAKEFGRFMPSANFIGKHVDEILPPAIAQASMAASNRALETGKEQIYEYQMNHRLTGHLRDYEARVTPSGVDEVQVIIRDVTAENQAEARFHQAQKLESLGMLAGGIAHDFNNLLTGMLAQNSLAKAKLIRGLPALEHVEKAITSAERAADLTRQLLAYTGRGKFQITALDLNMLIRENAGLLETALPNRAELQLQLTDQLPMIEADRGQIQQVVMNLVINATEALGPEGGYVRIVTQCQTIAETDDFAAFMADQLPPGAYVALDVIDNGTGMDETTIKRVFEPFFSTKTRGHGLGLAATLGIIRTHHGGIHVNSKLGSGTHFTVLFPVAATQPVAQPAMAGASQPVGAPVYNTKLQVLVIDDEAPIREVVADILTAEGITVLTATGGEEGIALYQQQPNIGLVVLDMKMPGMSGEETFRRLRAIDPAIQVILSSGYTETEIHHDFHRADIVAFLQKPYDIDQLLKYVHDALVAHRLADGNERIGS